ncbi:hypothetical protein [Oecophyllibacter saccharovorans]|uniref:hypothetical protein n=1 Tax=Oecophyllibacter saccharovorans TaxID=2558360 RepID=UPI0013F4D9DB|nr:hypothetical protein [Oecophyllibacter saccharovorans]
MFAFFNGPGAFLKAAVAQWAEMLAFAAPQEPFQPVSLEEIEAEIAARFQQLW